MSSWAWRLLRLLSTTGFILASVLADVAPDPAQAALADLPYRLEPAMTSAFGARQRGLVTDGALIVWEDSRTGSPDIYAYDLDDAREFRVASTPAHRTQPAIDGSIVLWVAGADPSQRVIEGIDLNTKTPLTLTSEPGAVSTPALSEGIAVWRERRGEQWDIVAKRLPDGEPFLVTDDPHNDAHPSVSGSTIVWQSYRDGQWDLYRYDLGTGRTEPLTATPDDETAPVVAGDHLLFRRALQIGGATQLILRNLTSGDERIIVGEHLVMQATLQDGMIAWEDWRSGLPDIYAFDIEHDELFAVARSQQAYCPAISNRVITWISRSNLVQGRVQAVAQIQRLPTDPREPPAVPSPDSLYVPETRHYMSAGFKSFWQANGGPTLFGYPVTEEFTETNPETGEERIVQYFERVKMEYNPEADPDHRISLARLGATVTAHRHFEPIEPPTGDDDRLYFPETGHSVAYGFKEFWEEHGGLAIFGFPISEEITENGRTVQYFERARFEFNPDADDGSGKVMLGLLGQETLQRMGWLPAPPLDTTSLLD